MSDRALRAVFCAALAALGFVPAVARSQDSVAPIAAPVSVAPPAAPATAAPSMAPTLRKCTAWAAHPPTEKKDFVFRNETMVKRSVEEMEVSYQMWDVADELKADDARDACRQKTRDFCGRNGATDDLCRFEVHPGIQHNGWDAAALVGKAKPVKKPKRPKAKKNKPAASTP